MNRLAIEKQAQVLAALVNGNSVLATVRMTGVAKNTIVKLLADVGDACLDYQDRHLRDLPCKRIECDEIWSFCYSKEKNVPADRKGEFGYGDVWTWVALDADTKLVPCWCVGDRSADTARDFMNNLADRLRHRVQLTTDGHSAYLEAVEEAFGYNVDYAMLVKMFGSGEGKTQTERKYSPGKVNGARKVHIQGTPAFKNVSTSYVERQNLTMRMSMRRFTRLTNAFSKKVENHMHAISLHYMYYNFCRPHKSLGGQTPAMAAGVANHQWSLEDVCRLALSN
jgi:IS1 family transposase